MSGKNGIVNGGPAIQIDETRDAARRAKGVTTVMTGSLVGLDSVGRPLVDIDGREGEDPLAALCATDARMEIGDSLALAFIAGDPQRPIIVGRLQEPRIGQTPREQELVLEADQQITLRCGKATLMLTRAGKVLLRGAYVSTHSSGVNRIKGGSVQIN